MGISGLVVKWGQYLLRDTDVTFSSPRFRALRPQPDLRTETAFSAGAIVGYNFCMPYRPAWERFFGVALDFQWNQFIHPGETAFGMITKGWGEPVCSHLPGPVTVPLHGK